MVLRKTHKAQKSSEVGGVPREERQQTRGANSVSF